ncbi:MAG: RNA polymerase factor sigma-54 [Pseudomonadota bacterium]
MKQSLMLKMSQQLTMTPQLQQAIKLLQLSSIDLELEIQQALESNPLLELNEEQESFGSEVDEPIRAAETVEDSEQSLDLEQQQDIPEDLPIDSVWDDVFSGSGSGSSGSSDDDDMNFDEKNTAVTTLTDHLLWQLNLTPFTDKDRLIAEILIESIDSRGYLITPLADLLETCQTAWIAEISELIDQDSEEDNSIDVEELEAVLHRIQHFEPAGIGARSLQECLILQLKQLESSMFIEYRDRAIEVLKAADQIKSQRDFHMLLRKAQISDEESKAVLSLIQTLDPAPGECMFSTPTEYVIPDVIVRKTSDRWRIELNTDAIPSLRINNHYASLARTDSASAGYIKQHLQEARWFIKSLQSRNETLLKVATQIVEHQLDFFEKGEEFMKPLILSDIAAAVGMHESTISRVTTQKFMHTTYGIFELKYFFSSHVNTESGGECSSTAIQAMIKKLVMEESPQNPLSDNQIADLMIERGINVARRTIAKYRKILKIASSNQRKKLID